MTMAVVHIKSDGIHSKVEVNGLDVTNATSELTLHIAADHIPTIELGLMVFDVSTYDGPAEVHIPAKTRAALIALGWIAPSKKDI